MHACDSWLELWRCLVLEFTISVWSYETQPWPIMLQLKRGKVKYTADILVALRNGRFRLEEIKHSSDINEKVIEKIEYLRSCLDPTILDVEIIEADEYAISVEVANLEFLYRYMRYPPSFSEDQIAAIKICVGRREWTVKDLASHLGKKLSIEVTDIWWMVGEGLLQTDLSAPLNADSLVRWRIRNDVP